MLYVYYAIIGDIINSKELQNRFEVQLKLDETLKSVNDEYALSIYSKFTITLGDEFQGLLNNADNLFEMLDYIRCKMYPVKIRFGIGIGTLSTRIERAHSMGSDGPAYWFARKAIVDVHDNNDYGHTMMRVVADTDSIDQTNIDLVNNSLRICDWMFNSWTEAQRKFICDLIPLVRYSKFKQNDVAVQLRLTAQAVNHKIQCTGILSYIATKTSLSHIIANIH